MREGEEKVGGGKESKGGMRRRGAVGESGARGGRGGRGLGWGVRGERGGRAGLRRADLLMGEKGCARQRTGWALARRDLAEWRREQAA